MNALEFLIANADAVIWEYKTHVEGRVFSAAYPPYLKDHACDLLEGKKYTIGNTDIVVRVFGGHTVNVSLCPRKARQLAVDDFRHDIHQDIYDTIERAGIVTEWTRHKWVSMKVELGSVTGAICITMKDFMNIVSKYREGKAPEHVIRRKYTSTHDTSEATFEIRKSVLLKEAGGSTPEQIAASQNTNSKSATAWGALLSKWSAGPRWAAAPYDEMAEELKDVLYQSISAQLLYKVFADIIAAQNPRVDISTNVNWPELANQQTKIMQDIKDAHHRHLAERMPPDAHDKARENQQRKTVMSPEIAAPYGPDADKQYSEDHAKQLASLDALIASPSMPDACKTLLRGCRHQFERADTYDQPGGERSMDKVVPMFNILYGKDLTKEQGWMFMMLVKAVRSANGNYSADSYEDGGSYWGLADEDAKKERK